MEIVLIVIGIALYVAQFTVVMIVVAGDVQEVKDYPDTAEVYYESKRQVLIDLIPGSWILSIVRPVSRWYKTLK